MRALEELLQALKVKCGFDAVEVNTKGQVRLVARVSNLRNWVILMQRMRVLELDRPWTLDLSQTYFLRTPSKKAAMVKAWRVILKAADQDAACRDLIKLVKDAPTARPTVDEMPLPGGGAHRGYNSSTGKGAQPFGGSSGPALNLFTQGGR